MTREKEIENQKIYGTEYPVCGNCENIREVAGKPWCEKYLTYRDFDDVKCAAYKFKMHLEPSESMMNLKH